MPTDWNRTPRDSPPKLADLQFREIAKSANFDNQISDFAEISNFGNRISNFN